MILFIKGDRIIFGQTGLERISNKCVKKEIRMKKETNCCNGCPGNFGSAHFPDTQRAK